MMLHGIATYSVIATIWHYVKYKIAHRDDQWFPGTGWGKGKSAEHKHIYTLKLFRGQILKFHSPIFGMEEKKKNLTGKKAGF